MTDEEIVREYGNMVYKIAFGYVRKTHDAEDVFSEVFLKLFKKKRNFISEEHRKAWLIRVTINCAKDFLGERMDYADIDSVAEKGEPAKTENIELREAILSLSDDYRDVIYMYYYEDLTVRKISEILELNENTVKTKLSRAREKLARFLAEEKV